MGEGEINCTWRDMRKLSSEKWDFTQQLPTVIGQKKEDGTGLCPTETQVGRESGKQTFDHKTMLNRHKCKVL